MFQFIYNTKARTQLDHSGVVKLYSPVHWVDRCIPAGSEIGKVQWFLDSSTTTTQKAVAGTSSSRVEGFKFYSRHDDDEVLLSVGAQHS